LEGFFEAGGVAVEGFTENGRWISCCAFWEIFLMREERRGEDDEGR
jgi:hypothetical protein